MNEEDALKYIVSWLKSPPRSAYSSFGYDVFIPNLIRDYISHNEILGSLDVDTRMRELSPQFLAAAWELCRRGITRPGIRILGAQSTSEGSGGAGFSITPFGRTWLDETGLDYFVPTEPGRFARILSSFKARLGQGFHERAQEAIRCYGAHAYFACCAMCGAAAESILLAIATSKDDEQKVLAIYRTSHGRGKVENMVIGHARQQLQKEFRGFTTLLKYWRDEASHGHASGISDDEAYTSLALLLRFAHYVDDHWEEFDH